MRCVEAHALPHTFINFCWTDVEDLYTKFQQAIYDVLSLPCPAEKCTFDTVDLQIFAILLKVQQKSGLKNLILEKKIDTVKEASFAWQKMIYIYNIYII